MMMMVRRPLPSGMVVVGWMTVPLAERSTAGCAGFLVAAPAEAPNAESAATAAATMANGRRTRYDLAPAFRAGRSTPNVAGFAPLQQRSGNPPSHAMFRL